MDVHGIINKWNTKIEILHCEQFQNKISKS
jgi:hypothetical protein